MILEEQCLNAKCQMPILPRWHVAVQTATADLSLNGGERTTDGQQSGQKPNKIYVPQINRSFKK